MSRTLSRPERIAWARLARTPRIGPLTFHRLLARFKTPAAALEALPRISDLKAPPAEKAEAEIEGVEALGAARCVMRAGLSAVARRTRCAAAFDRTPR